MLPQVYNRLFSVVLLFWQECKEWHTKDHAVIQNNTGQVSYVVSYSDTAICKDLQLVNKFIHKHVLHLMLWNIHETS